MIGPERGRYAQKIPRMLEAARRAEAVGFSSIWVPQIPDEFDALTAITLIGQVTERVELGTAVMVIQTRHPVAMAQQALSTQLAVGGRLTVGLGPSHHWIVEDMLGLSYDKPARQVRDYLEVLRAAFAGPGSIDVDNDTWHVHNPIDVTDQSGPPVLLAALAPMMLRIAGELADGTILWMADERAIGDHIAPRINKAAADAGRPPPRVVAGVPVTLCRNDEADEARARANRVLSEAEMSPNYQRLLEQGDARQVGDIHAAGDEAAVAARLRAFRDAGATDLSIRIVPIGADRDARLECWRRTEEHVASLVGEL